MIVHSYNENVFTIYSKRVGPFIFPCRGEEYIIDVYGEDWLIPVEKWDWRTDHLCRDDNLKIKLIEKYGN
jgi:hypothetical protein